MGRKVIEERIEKKLSIGKGNIFLWEEDWSSLYFSHIYILYFIIIKYIKMAT